MVFRREFPVPSEGVRITKENVEAQVGQKRLGKGVLYVAENAISWIYSQSADEGFRILYPEMVLHAVSRDRDLCPADCIYVMLNQRMSSSPEAGGDNEPEPGEDPEDEMTEIRFMPEDPSCLQELYTIISECNLLHDPPPSNSSDEADNGDDYNPGLADEDMDQEDDDDDRLAMFNRMNIHFGNGGGAGDGTDGTHHPEQFDPHQFEDAD